MFSETEHMTTKSSNSGNLGGGAKIAAFRKRFGALLKTDKVVKMVVTPEIAAEMLKRNKSNNRNIRQGKIEQYSREMSDGNWLLTGQGISFDRNGSLSDGQHRLTACVASQHPFHTIVAFGLNPKGFMKVDSGGARTAADIFHINGVKHCNNQAAATRWVEAYCRNMIGTARSSNSGLSGGAFGFQATSEDIWGWYLKHKDIDLRTDKISLFGKSKLMPPSVALAFYTLFCRKSKSQADEYVEKVFSGVGITSKRDPAHAVRQRFIEDRAKVTGRLKGIEAACFLVKGWNATRDGKSVGVLRWSKNEEFPRIR